MSWKGQRFPLQPGTSPGSTGSRTFQAPAGFRDSPEPPLAPGEVVSSMYTVRHELARGDSGGVFEVWDMLLERAAVLKLAWRDPGAPSLVPEARRCAAVAAPSNSSARTLATARSPSCAKATRSSNPSAAGACWRR